MILKYTKSKKQKIYYSKNNIFNIFLSSIIIFTLSSCSNESTGSSPKKNKASQNKDENIKNEPGVNNPQGKDNTGSQNGQGTQSSGTKEKEQNQGQDVEYQKKLKEEKDPDKRTLNKINHFMKKDPYYFLNCLIFSQDIKNKTVKDEAKKVMATYLNNGAKASELKGIISAKKYGEMFKEVFENTSNLQHNKNILNKDNAKIKNIVCGLSIDDISNKLDHHPTQIDPFLCSVRFILLQAYILGVDISIAYALELYLTKYNPAKIIKEGSKDNPIYQMGIEMIKNNHLNSDTSKKTNMNEKELFIRDLLAIGAPGKVLSNFIKEASKNKIEAKPILIQGTNDQASIAKVEAQISAILKNGNLVGGYDYQQGKNTDKWHYSIIIAETDTHYFILGTDGKLFIKEKKVYIESLYLPKNIQNVEFNKLVGLMENCSKNNKLGSGALIIDKGGYNIVEVKKA